MKRATKNATRNNRVQVVNRKMYRTPQYVYVNYETLKGYFK